MVTISSGSVAPELKAKRSKVSGFALVIGYIIPQNPQNHMELGVLVFYVTVIVSGVLVVAATCLAVIWAVPGA